MEAKYSALLDKTTKTLKNAITVLEGPNATIEDVALVRGALSSVDVILELVEIIHQIDNP